MIIVMIVVGLFYAGISVYANLQTQLGEYKLPSSSEAKYEFTIRNTGSVLYTDIYSIRGMEFTLIGYWELVEDKYQYRDRQLILDQQIFGTITVRRR